MNSPAKALRPLRDPIYTEGKKMGQEISELSAYIYAATYRQLVLIGKFDEKGFWKLNGICSCAHWLNFQCGIGMNAAREKVRVANALKDLPRVSKAFKKGELSYSKARAITRIANEKNEEYLMMIARHGTAHHVEKLVSKYRTCKRLQDAQNANQQHALRKLSYYYDDTGSLIINGRFPPEQGAMILKALDMAIEQADAESRKADKAAKDESLKSKQGDEDTTDAEVTAVTRPRESVTVRRADALSSMAESYLNNGPISSGTADRFQVVVHVSAETLKENQTPISTEPRVTAETSAHISAELPHIEDHCRVTAETSTYINADLSHIEDGPHVTAETSRRIACDCSIYGIIEDDEGEPLSIGRKTRSIPPAMRRALRSRDQGCRFPRCNNTHFIDGHHIQHWADGGETSMVNLIQLCWHHHRLVHEGGFGCERLPNGQVLFTDQRGEKLARSPVPISVADEDAIDTWMHSIATEFDIDDKTCVPHWYAGDTMDWGLAVGHLFS